MFGIYIKIRQRNGYKDIKSFYSMIDRAVDSVKSSGVNIKSRRIENDDFVELTILMQTLMQAHFGQALCLCL